MSTAIMHNTAPLYDFGDLFLKNQASTRSIWHLQQQNANNNISSNLNNNNNNNTVTTTTTSPNTLSPTPATNNPNSQLLSNVLGSSMQSLISNGSIPVTNANNHQQQQQHQANNGNLVNSTSLNNNFNYSAAVAAAAVTNPALLQQHINAVVAQQQQQQQQQEQQKKLWIHNALTRAASHPPNGSTVALVNTLIENLNGHHNTLIENIGSGHRKLERTQSEPLPQVNTSRYKTELCRPFEEEGECKYGEKCQFAHGAHELRNLQRHPKYKTEYCRTFHSVGFCPYGPRCHFIHNVDEARTITHLPGGYNRLTAAAVAAATAAAQNNSNHSLPLTPPLSMSTGSDRASPAGSLSLSPTTSMATFPFSDQISPACSVFQGAFTFNTPPASPQSGMSTVTTPSPPPTIVSSAQIIPTQSQQQQHQQHTNINNHGLNHSLHTMNHHQMLNNTNASKQHSAIARPQINPSKIGGGGNANKMNTEDGRLPIFDFLSSTLDAFNDLSI